MGDNMLFDEDAPAMLAKTGDSFWRPRDRKKAKEWVEKIALEKFNVTLRPDQKDIINSFIDGNNILMNAATGMSETPHFHFLTLTAAPLTTFLSFDIIMFQPTSV
jgi:hypothetical protein